MATATFNERFREYTTDMGIDAQLGEEILGIDKKTFYAYRGSQKTGRTPTLSGLLIMARVFGVTSDWLSGDASYPKWRDEIGSLRLWLLGQATAMDESLIEQERMVAVCRLIADHLEQAKQPWFMPGILGISCERFESFMACEGDISTPMTERLAAFTGLPKSWLRLGGTEDLRARTNADLDPAWVEVVDQYKRMGHQPEDHLQFGPAIDDLVQRQKRMANA